MRERNLELTTLETILDEPGVGTILLAGVIWENKNECELEREPQRMNAIKDM